MSGPHPGVGTGAAQTGAAGGHLTPTAGELARLRRVAAGTEDADLIVRGGTVVTLHTGELLERDVVVAGRHIAAVTPVGRFGARRTVDARGLHVLPTYVDAHLHIEHTMLTPGELARLVVPRGTGAVLADPTCLAAVLGPRGMDLLASTATPLRILQQVSPEVPRRPGLELGGATLPEEEVAARLRRRGAAALGESRRSGAPDAATRRQAAALAAGRPIVGHSGGLDAEPLWSYLAGGVADDHTAATTAEALERLRLGAAVAVTAGSLGDCCPAVFADLPALAGALDAVMFCADDKHVGDIAREGHLDHHVRQAVAAGVDPVAAVRMATLNPARHFRLDHVLGSLAPSRLADLQLVGDLAAARPDLVVLGGRVAAEGGRAVFTNPDAVPGWARETVRVDPRLCARSFAVPAAGPRAWIQAAEVYRGYLTRAFHAELPVVDGAVCADPSRDVCKLAVVDRHHASGAVGVGFVRGFGLRQGCIAATTNRENQNAVLLGADDADMVTAVRALEGMGGGYVVVDRGWVRAACPLPVGGVMSDAPWEDVVAALSGVNAAAAALGCTLPAPFTTLAFVGLAGVGDLGLTERGLVDVAAQALTPAVLPVLDGRPACRCPDHRDAVHQLFDPAGAAS